MILVHEKTGIPVTVGEELTDFRGNKAVCTSITEGMPAPSSNSSGRIYAKSGKFAHGYFPGVFDCMWVEEV